MYKFYLLHILHLQQNALLVVRGEVVRAIGDRGFNPQSQPLHCRVRPGTSRSHTQERTHTHTHTHLPLPPSSVIVWYRRKLESNQVHHVKQWPRVHHGLAVWVGVWLMAIVLFHT